jgi:hypothetical protein
MPEGCLEAGSMPRSHRATDLAPGVCSPLRFYQVLVQNAEVNVQRNVLRFFARSLEGFG